MVNPFTCGGGGFHSEEEDEWFWSTSSPNSSPARRSRRRNRENRNPYSTLGLDKFSKLLADLEEKRQNIYAQMGSDHISFVRFAYPTANQCVPIIVKLKDKSPSNDNNNRRRAISTPTSPTHRRDSEQFVVVAAGKEAGLSSKSDDRPETEKRGLLLKSCLGLSKLPRRLRWPAYYMPAIVIAILLLLTVFGRSVAILCTTLAWYLVPAHDGTCPEDRERKRPAKKKILARRMSDNCVKMSRQITGLGSSPPKPLAMLSVK